MSGSQLNIVSNCARSPFFSCTRDRALMYGEYANRLTPLLLGRDKCEEYWVLRKSVGLYDVPERPVEICGKDSIKFLNRVFTRPVETLKVGRGRYALLCHQRGGVVCDGIVFKLEENRYWYVHADGDIYTWLVAHAEGFSVNINDPHSWALQIQGPRALDVLAKCCDKGPPESFRYFHSSQCRMGGQEVLISRTGWTGELGFEVFNMDPDVDGPALWNHLLEAGDDFGIRECGTLGMNCRRIEAGILNYGTDMDWETTPFAMGLGQFVDLDSHDFVGRDALLKANRETRFTGFKSHEGNIKWGTAVLQNGQCVGRVKAFEQSPHFKCGVGFVLLNHPSLMHADGLSVIDRQGRERPVELSPLPFYDSQKRIPRGLQTIDFPQQP